MNCEKMWPTEQFSSERNISHYHIREAKKFISESSWCENKTLLILDS